MRTMNKQLFRIVSTVEYMSTRGALRFGTITVKRPDVPLHVVSDMWRNFANGRWWRKLSRGKDYVMVYEPHPNGHGWHIHFLCNFYVPIRQLVYEVGKYGFGVCWMEHVSPDTAWYISKYVVKSRKLLRRSNYRRVRLVNVSRTMLPLSDVVVRSSSIDFVRRWWRFSDLPFQVRAVKLFQDWLCTFCPSF